MLRQIVYASSCVHPSPETDVDLILRASRRNNRALGITGALIALDRTFFQVLEGPEDVVRTLYAKIMMDPRHRSILSLLDRPVSERRFGEWLMAWAEMPPNHPLATHIKRFATVDDLSTPEQPFDPQVLVLLKTFVRNTLPERA